MTTARRQLTVAEAVPVEWLDFLSPQRTSSKIGLGLDVATTEGAKSNPSALAVVERVGGSFFERLLMRWKTSDPAITEAVIRRVVELLASRNRKARKLAIDASSEKFFAADIRKTFMGVLQVECVVNSESIVYLGQKMSYKVYLGNLYINTIDDGNLAIPDESWVKADARQVTRSKGTFVTTVDESGNHGDGFDATKLALHTLISPHGGPLAAAAAKVGSAGGAPSHQWLNPHAAAHERNHSLIYV